MKVFLKYNNQWQAFKGAKAFEKAIAKGEYIFKNFGIRSTIYHKGYWTPVIVYK